MADHEFAHLAAGSWQDALQAVRVVIPAKDVGRTIGATIRYLAALGLRREQIHVVVNGCADDTVEQAEVTGRATVHHQEAIFDSWSGPLTRALDRYGLTRDNLRGKGSAMLAVLLVLDGLGLADDTPVLFLDGDIRNIQTVDPANRLLAAWNVWQDETRIVKLAATGWDLAIRAALATHPVYHLLSALEWPLCGQMVVRWTILRHLRFATGYAVEVAMLMQLWESFQYLEVFGQVETATPLEDGYSSPHDLTTMYATILAFLRRYEGRSGLTRLSPSEISALNGERPQLEFYAPSPDGRMPGVFERRLIDALLPSIVEIGRGPRR